MPTSLRAFLMLRLESGEWAVSVHRNLEALLTAWKDRPGPDSTTGVIHVGFDRPPSREFEVLARNHPGRALVTAAARFALPPDFLAARMPAGWVGMLPVFLAIRGWGYLLDEPAQIVAREPIVAPRAAEGWVREFVIRAPDSARALQEADIWDDADYLVREAALPHLLRRQLGAHRLRHLLGSVRDDPCALAQAAPPWLAKRPLESMSLTVRLSHVFTKLGLETVGDLACRTLPDLLREKNFGRTSVKDLLGSLEEALAEGPFTVDKRLDDASEIPLLTSIRRSLLKCGGREADIVRRRMGLDAPSETLQQIGESYRLTRERIRQIEAKVIKRLQREEYWDDLLTKKLITLLRDRDFPLPILGVEAADPWFEGMAEFPNALRYVLTNICERGACVLTIDGIDYFGFLDQEKWVASLREARRFMEAGAGNQWSEEYVRSIVQGLLAEGSREFRTLLWQKASALCHFTDDGLGERRLTSYGQGAEQVVEAVLSDAEKPLHFSEIAPLASVRAGRAVDIRRAHIAAASVGLLLGRGIYGVDRHLPLYGGDLAVLGMEAEEVVSDGPPGRQWHASEILAALGERGSRYLSGVDKYILDIALQRSGGLKRLGRMVWVGDRHGEGGNIARIDQRQAVIALLQQAGRPLRATEIRQRLIAIRGVNEYFQIMGVDPLIRVGAGIWGLNDRDIALKRAEQVGYLDQLVDVLRKRGTAIHATEMSEGLVPVDGLPVAAIFSLCGADPRMHVNTAQYLYLTEWGDPRRESISEAAERVLIETSHPLSLDEILAQVERRVGRSCDRSAISGCLHAVEAIWDEATGHWSRRAQEDLIGEDDLVFKHQLDVPPEEDLVAFPPTGSRADERRTG